MCIRDRNNAFALGRAAFSGGGNATAIGTRANAGGSSSVAIGSDSIASASRSVALGDEAESTHTNSVAIGFGASTAFADQIVLGTNITIYTLPGLGVGGASRGTANQSGDIQFVTTDDQGNLLSLIHISEPTRPY